MIQLNQLTDYLNNLLNVNLIRDYAPNGLQVSGKKTIKKIVTGVSACQDLLNRAVAEDADAIIVHHGYFWKNENPCLTGIKYDRLKTLFANDMSLLSYHLPLDVHPVYGNNAQLGNLLKINLSERIVTHEKLELVHLGALSTPQTAKIFNSYLKTKLNREPFYVGKEDQVIKTIAWCTGAGQDFIELAVQYGADAYLTGEVSERTVHIARETGIHFFAAGHHATERYGISALGEHLAAEFKIHHQFIDIDNPI